jgi:hypothetical protein
LGSLLRTFGRGCWCRNPEVPQFSKTFKAPFPYSADPRPYLLGAFVDSEQGPRTSRFVLRLNPQPALEHDASFGAPLTIAAMTGGDFDGDGTLDLATLLRGASKLRLQLVLGPASAPLDGVSQLYAVANIRVFDYNADGKDDVVVVGENELRILTLVP